MAILRRTVAHRPAACRIAGGNMVSTERLAYRKSEVAQALGCSLDTIDRLIARGELRGFKVGAARFVSSDELREFIRSREQADAGPGAA